MPTITNIPSTHCYTNGNEEENNIFFFHSDHLGSTSYLTDKDGNACEYVCYMPYGESIVDENNTDDQNIFKFTGKELDRETGLHYFGARYFDKYYGIWYGPDELREDAPMYSPYSFCYGNPIKYKDSDGRWGWAVAGAAIDYGLQVYDNYQSGKSGYDAWVGEVNFVSVGLSAVNPMGKAKVLKTVLVEGAKASISYSQNKGLQIESNVKKVVVNTTVNTITGKLSDASNAEAVQKANKMVSNTTQQLKTAERQAVAHPNSPVKAQNVVDAKVNAQNARNQQVVTKTLNSTVGKAPNAVQTGASIITNRALKADEE